jgi:membrane protease YdiL (CAAX protease family)
MDTAAPTPSLSAHYLPVAGGLHTISLCVMLGVWAFLGQTMVNRMAAAANPHRIRTYLLTLIFEWLLFAYVAAGIRRHGESIRVILGDRWDSFRQLARDIGIAAAFWILAAFLLAIVARILNAAATRRDIGFLLPRGALEFTLWIALSITAGICEEAIFRGYLQRQLIAFTRSAPAGILLSAVAFGAGHGYQGSRMPILIAFYGVFFGVLAHWRGSVRPGMIAHAWQDSLNGVVALLKLR